MNQEQITNIALDLLWEKVQSLDSLLIQERCEHRETKELLESEVTRRRHERQDADRIRIQQCDEWRSRCSRNREGYMSQLSEIEDILKANKPNAIEAALRVVQRAMANEELPF